LIHNLKYDSKIFLSWLLKLCDEYKQENDLNIIPKNNENYNTFSRKVIIDEYEQQYDLTKCLRCNQKYYDKIFDKCPKCNESNLNIKRKGDKFPKTMEFRFIDTLAFVGTSLDKAVKNLAEV
ncbi:MAG: hypothetical protein H9Q67_07365, partial [Spiroplasma ixodetis]|nr:hypothetical protein [Spiroplasma ixodetis]